MMRQNKLFSAIYIGGTAIAIATTTVFAVIYYVKLAPIYPEYQRGRTGYVTLVACDMKSGAYGQGQLGYSFVRDYLYPLKSAECVSGFMGTSWDNNFVVASDGLSTIPVDLKPTDPAFFDIYGYDFLEGAPFSQTDLDNGVRRAVITDVLANKLFGTTGDVVGKTVSLNYADFEVTGVVRAGSTINKFSYADIFTPYTTYTGYDNLFFCSPMGVFRAVIVADDIEAVQAELAEAVRKYNSSQDEEEVEIYNQPSVHAKEDFGFWPGQEFSLGEVVRKNLIILLVLLLVPALNLSGMISGRMEMRSAELGVRKSFGATRGKLLWQVVWENFLMTLIGGAIGLLISWGVIYATSGTILQILNSHDALLSVESTITPDMMFSPWVFLIALVLCLVLNLMAALVPAWWSLRRPIVQSLKEK